LVVTDLLSFAARSRLPVGFGYLLADGSVDAERPLETWINARMTHVFGLAALEGSSSELVRHGVEALLGPLQDARYGGWFRSSADRTKAAYEHAFVVLAGSTASACGAGDELLTAALEVWDERFWDDAAGAVVEEHSADWASLSPYRGANSNMHGVEAVLAAADALPARADELRGRALRVVERFVHREARSRDWRLPEHFDSDWVADLDYNAELPADPFRPFGVTVGHQLEWARLAVHLEAVLPDAPSWLLDDARALYDAAVARGGAADGHAGFVYTLDWQDRPVVTARMHWVLAEAIAAAHVLARRTGEASYAEDAAHWTAHAAERFEDPTTGSWHHELTPTGEVATGTWQGQPDAYHVHQARLLGRLPLAGSVAGALRG
jgi:mannose/cellobiose epimerase-like protein (N-acyl-D-glucosamine 2-epimerase family)